jgi:hypothetical protein
VQAFGASLWIAYGVMLNAKPVVLANVLVAGAALLSLWRDRRSQPAPSAVSYDTPAA